MKFNKWTLGLAAVGVVSLASAAKADEKLSAVQTALSSTTISGYVDTSAQWNLGTAKANYPLYKFGGAAKADGFNLNVVQLSIAKPLDESEWASGYKVDLWFGPDANAFPAGLGTTSTGATADLAIRQAYVALRTPVGNGIDWKIGVFDSIIGYESVESGNNPNFTRSYGHTLEPQTHTGLLGTYRFSEEVAVSAGVANTFGPMINGRANPPKAESYKTYMASIALTAPQSWGWAAGSTLYGGVVNGLNKFAGLFSVDQTSYYAGATLATPLTGLKVGVAYDYAGVSKQPLTVTAFAPGGISAYANAVAGYVSYQATEKLSFHGRAEYAWGSVLGLPGVAGLPSKIFAATATVQYDLWQNVISRLELRWDHQANGTGHAYGAPNTVADVLGGSRRNALMVVANIIYKF
jgi:hypothetical protein